MEKLVVIAIGFSIGNFVALLAFAYAFGNHLAKHENAKDDVELAVLKVQHRGLVQSPLQWISTLALLSVRSKLARKVTAPPPADTAYRGDLKQ